MYMYIYAYTMDSQWLCTGIDGGSAMADLLDGGEQHGALRTHPGVVTIRRHQQLLIQPLHREGGAEGGGEGGGGRRG